MSDKLKIMAGAYNFVARFESVSVPKTVAAFRELLPYRPYVIIMILFVLLLIWFPDIVTWLPQTMYE